MRFVGVVLVALVLVPAAAAWKPLSTVPVINTMHPGVLRAASTFRGGNLVYSTIAGGGTFSGGDPHPATGVDPANRIWAVWTQNGVKATLRGGGKTVVTSAAGVAKLGAFKRGTRITVTAPGYAPGSFRKA